MSKKVFIVAANRSPIASFNSILKDVTADELGVQVVSKMLDKRKVPKEAIDEVIVGNVISAGLGQNVARQISVKAGIPFDVPAYSVNMVCGSGMKSVMNGFMSIQAGFNNVVVAGGVESMSNAPYIVSGKVRSGVKMGNLEFQDTILKDALMDSFSPIHMGITAENIAEKHKLLREELDKFSYESQVRAINAVDTDKFVEEIIPIEIKSRKETVVFDKDEYPNRSTNLEKLAKLRPAFKQDGIVTAGSSSGINDGASFVVIASEEAVKKHNLHILAEIVEVGQGALDPNYMGLGPVPAINNVLSKANVKLSDLEIIELNEAFAAQSLGVINELAEQHGVNKEALLKMTNVNGGAIALGHPLGASGNRIIVTLVHEMIKQNKHLGLASLCIGGGMGTAILIKR
ncbi:MAG: acetyl-CoA C-acetyltransferase [Acholeplasmataceae bacterium]